ncbi:MAG: hydrogenase maturation protease [Mycobacteriaceae bacterium]|nr:hydrogenase maturation protease [Mycobacteriaceae bacterium]
MNAVAADIVVIGIGNDYRRDDGVGPAVASAINARKLPGVRVVIGIEDPIVLLDAWSGVALAVVIDAAVASPAMPGRIRRIASCTASQTDSMSTHGLDVTQTLALGQALGREPHRLVLFTVEAADISHGVGLTPPVADAVPAVVSAAIAEIVSAS